MSSIYINVIVDMHYHFKFCLSFSLFYVSFFLLIENQYPPRGISIFITNISNTLRKESVYKSVKISRTIANDNDTSIILHLEERKPIQKFYF